MFFCFGVLAETETNENIQKIINAESADSQVKKLDKFFIQHFKSIRNCLLYTSPSPRDRTRSRMPSSA